MSLMFRQGRKHKKKWASGDELHSRSEQAVKFLSATSAIGSTAHWSLLQQEEVAHVCLTTLRKVFLDRDGFGNWKEYCTVRPKEAEEANRKVNPVFSEMLFFAFDALKNVGVKPISLPAIPASDVDKVALEASKKHRDLLMAHPKIDSMDALHLIAGHLMGCQAFMSFDRSWQIFQVDGYSDQVDPNPKDFGE